MVLRSVSRRSFRRSGFDHLMESLEKRVLLSTVVVNTIQDGSIAGFTSLRDAIITASQASDATTITFDPTVFATPQTITLNGNDLELSNPSQTITIQGPATGVTINGNNASQGVLVDDGVTAVISGLTISNCNSGLGAGIQNDGILTLVNCTLSNNDATGNDDGGGIANLGTATLINDTIANNIGGGLNPRSGTISLVNCTVTGNYNYEPFSGAGIYEQGGAVVTISNSIVAGNTAQDGGGPDVYGSFNSSGFNLIGATDGSTGWISTDLTGSVASLLDPKLGALTNNGGPTATLLPMTGSPAIAAGSVSFIPAGITTDQRGDARTFNGTVDIGAVEAEAKSTAYVPPKKIGGLDLNFGTNGLASHDVGFTTTDGLAADGTQSVIIGTVGTAPTESFGLTRYNADGSLDTAFGTGGVAVTNFGSTGDVPSAVTVLANGQILVAGTATTYAGDGTVSGSQFAVEEFNTDGSLNTAFGTAGQTLISFSTTAISNDVLNAMTTGPGGVIYLGGSSDAASTGSAQFALAALASSGALNTGFGVGGTVLLAIGDGADAINGLAVQRTGAVVAAGYATTGGVVEIALARFLPTGGLDLHFGTKGIVTSQPGAVYDSATSVAIQTNSEIVLCGLSAGGSGAALGSNFVIQRYTAAGRVDRTFASGTVIGNFNQPSAATQVVVQSNGEIVVSGKTTASLASVIPNQLELAVARYTARGLPDGSFNGTGKVIIDLSQGVVTGASAGRSSVAQSSLSTADLLTTAADLGSEFDAFVSAQQGATAITPGGEILDAGNSGANTVEAEIIVAGVDLLTKILSALPVSVLGGSKGTATVSLTETGTTLATGTVALSVQLATDSAGDGAVSVYTLNTRINLKQNQTHSYRLAFKYSASLPTGAYFLLVTVSESAALNQLNPADATAASSATVNIAPPAIALAGTNLMAPANLTPSKSAALTLDITNNGNVIARGKTIVEIFLSPDQTTADGTQIATVNLSLSLAAGKSRVYPLRFKLPATVTAGMYNLLAILDPLNSLGADDSSDVTVVDPNTVGVG